MAVIIIQEIGKRLKKLRECFGLKQDDVAAYLQVTPTTICNYENGTIFPNLEKFYKLVLLFQTSADYLLGIDEDKRMLININETTLEQEQFLMDIIRIYKQMFTEDEGHSND